MEHIVYVVLSEVASKYMAFGPQVELKFSTVLYGRGSFGNIGCTLMSSNPKRSSTDVFVKLLGIARLKPFGHVVEFGMVPLLSVGGHNS